NKTGDLMARATNDLRAMRRLTGFGLMQAFTTVVMFAFALHFMLQISVPLTLLSLAPLPFVIIVMYSFIGKIHKLFNFIQEQFSTLTAKAQENFSGIRVIKSYVREDWEIDAFKKENVEYINRNISLAQVDAFLDATLDFLLGLSAIAVIWYGGRLVIHGKLSLGELVALFSYIAMLAWPMAAIGYLINMWQKAFAAAQRILNIMSQPADIADTAITDHSIAHLDGAIEFDHVTFRYPDAPRPALQDITFSVQQGQTIAVVGATGAGKSTLIHLLPRLIEANAGSIRIGGYDIRTIPLQVLRGHIGIVQQESFLFSDTLAGNIAFGVADADKDIISNAVEISQLKLDIDQFPDGLDTIIGERGITLSGGQKQRASISRAVIRKPTLLILDDALSAVDTYTEEEILNQIRPVMQECTTIIVAHRISTIRDADIILVLDNGKIIERGTHEELVQRRGTYHKMFERQRLEEHFKQLD
ncbi:ABC transporter ATP-binding protein, partial [candidate division KSB1 bacterium]